MVMLFIEMKSAVSFLAIRPFLFFFFFLGYRECVIVEEGSYITVETLPPTPLHYINVLKFCL